MSKSEALRIKIVEVEGKLRELQDEAFLGKVTPEQKAEILKKKQEWATLRNELSDLERGQVRVETAEKAKAEKEEEARQAKVREGLPGLFSSWLAGFGEERELMIATYRKIGEALEEAKALWDQAEVAHKIFYAALDSIGLDAKDPRVLMMQRKVASKLRVNLPVDPDQFFDFRGTARGRFWLNSLESLKSFLGEHRSLIQGFREEGKG